MGSFSYAKIWLSGINQNFTTDSTNSQTCVETLGCSLLNHTDRPYCQVGLTRNHKQRHEHIGLLTGYVETLTFD